MRHYNFAFLDEQSKREVRRQLLKAVAIPGYQVPFASPELPIARGWGTGGLLVTMSLIGPSDVLKVIDQGSDDVVNAVNLRQFMSRMAGVQTTTRTGEASLIQTRHRIPETPLRADQILVFQVPYPEIFYKLEPSMEKARRMHAEMDYRKLWVQLYEEVVNWGDIQTGAEYPLRVHERYVMDPSPIPRWDCLKLNQAQSLFLFGSGREKRLYAVPPHTRVEPLQFDDVPFQVEDFQGKACARCGATDAFLNEDWDSVTGRHGFFCSDSDYCDSRLSAGRGHAPTE